MPRLFPTPRCRLIGATLVAMLASAAAAAAEDGAHPLDSALEMLNLKTRPGAMPDFVTRSRESQSADSYIPVGQKPPARGLKPKSAADVKALAAELDAARAAQIAGRRPKPMGDGARPKPGPAAAKTPRVPAKAADATNR